MLGVDNMRVILNLTEEQVRDLNEISSTNNESFEEILMRAFYKHTFEPSYQIGELILNNKYEEYSQFTKLLAYYLNEAVIDIKDSARSEEAYDTDVAMARVFERIRDEHILKPTLTVDLYHIFKEKFKKELR